MEQLGLDVRSRGADRRFEERTTHMQNCYGVAWSLFSYQKGQFIAEHIPIFSIFSKSAKLPVAKVMDD